MPIPDDSPDWLFGVTGFFAALGVPIMGVAMASLGALLMERRDDMDEMKKIIEAEVTAEEILDLQRFGLEDGDGEIDKAEFVILCMVRLGTDPRLVQFISDQFQKLDDDGSNSLSILEITRGRVSSDDLQKLGQSEAYKKSRRLSDMSAGDLKKIRQSDASKSARRLIGAAGDKGSGVSLSSIPEAHHDADEENNNRALAEGEKEDAENGTAETECDAIPEEDIDEGFEDNPPTSDAIEEDDLFHDTFEENEHTLAEDKEEGIFF